MAILQEWRQFSSTFAGNPQWINSSIPGQLISHGESDTLN
jgi:hypothetical protein